MLVVVLLLLLLLALLILLRPLLLLLLLLQLPLQHNVPILSYSTVLVKVCGSSSAGSVGSATVRP